MTLKGLMYNWWWRIISLANKRRGGLGSNWACKDALPDGLLNMVFLPSNGGAYGVLEMFTARMTYSRPSHWRGLGPDFFGYRCGVALDTGDSCNPICVLYLHSYQFCLFSFHTVLIPSPSSQIPCSSPTRIERDGAAVHSHRVIGNIS